VRRLSRRSHLIIGGLGLSVVLLVLFLIWPAWAYQWPGIGLGASYGPPMNPKLPRTYYPRKTLWDWMQLFVVPVVLAGAALWFNWTEKRRDQRIVQETRTADQTIAEDRQQETALGEYLVTMTTLLLDKDLRTSAEGDEVRAVARVQTLTVLRRLNGERKGSVVRFLSESHLIDKVTPIVDLIGADLSEADLSRATLRRVNLREVNLTNAVLTDVVLADACLDNSDFSGADLVKADLASASLDGANLHGARLWSTNLNQAVLGEIDRGSARVGTFRLGEVVVGGSAVGGANLSEANLSNAMLRDAILVGVDLRDAQLRGADLRRTNLSGARGKTNDELEREAASLTGATMPDGLIHQ